VVKVKQEARIVESSKDKDRQKSCLNIELEESRIGNNVESVGQYDQGDSYLAHQQSERSV
jgi:hypothetical protein